MQFLDHIDKDEFNHIMIELEDDLFVLKEMCFAKTTLLHYYVAQLPSETDRVKDKMRDALLEFDRSVERLTGDMRKNLPFLRSDID